MGLREKKAVRTRAQIMDVALALFLDKGYDETTMEEIAEGAEVGTSTLYRYFPAKDQILLGSLDDAGALANSLRARPADEPLSVALGNAIRATLEVASVDERQHLAIRTIVDRAAGPRARLWDIVAQERTLLENAVAERIGRPVDDLQVVMSARIALLVVEVVGDTWRYGDHRVSVDQLLESTLIELGVTGIVLPAAAAAADN